MQNTPETYPRLNCTFGKKLSHDHIEGASMRGVLALAYHTATGQLHQVRKEVKKTFKDNNTAELMEAKKEKLKKAKCYKRFFRWIISKIIQGAKITALATSLGIPVLHSQWNQDILPQKIEIEATHDPQYLFALLHGIDPSMILRINTLAEKMKELQIQGVPISKMPIYFVINDQHETAYKGMLRGALLSIGITEEPVFKFLPKSLHFANNTDGEGYYFGHGLIDNTVDNPEIMNNPQQGKVNVFIITSGNSNLREAQHGAEAALKYYNYDSEDARRKVTDALNIQTIGDLDNDDHASEAALLSREIINEIVDFTHWIDPEVLSLPNHLDGAKNRLLQRTTTENLSNQSLREAWPPTAAKTMVQMIDNGWHSDDMVSFFVTHIPQRILEISDADPESLKGPFETFEKREIFFSECTPVYLTDSPSGLQFRKTKNLYILDTESDTLYKIPDKVLVHLLKIFPEILFSYEKKGKTLPTEVVEELEGLGIIPAQTE